MFALFDGVLPDAAGRRVLEKSEDLFLCLAQFRFGSLGVGILKRVQAMDEHEATDDAQLLHDFSQAVVLPPAVLPVAFRVVSDVAGNGLAAQEVAQVVEKRRQMVGSTTTS